MGNEGSELKGHLVGNVLNCHLFVSLHVL